MDIEDIQKIHHSIWLHFNSKSFDITKYGFSKKPKTEPNAYHDAIGKKLNDKSKVIYYFVSNFVDSYEKTRKISPFIGDYMGKEHMLIYDKWKMKMKSIDYYFNRNFTDLEEYVSFEEGVSYPRCMKEYIRGNEILEFFPIVLMNNPELKEYWLKNAKDKYFFPVFLDFCERYGNFLKSSRFLKEDRKIGETFYK